MRNIPLQAKGHNSAKTRGNTNPVRNDHVSDGVELSFLSLKKARNQPDPTLWAAWFSVFFFFPFFLFYFVNNVIIINKNSYYVICVMCIGLHGIYYEEGCAIGDSLVTGGEEEVAAAGWPLLCAPNKLLNGPVENSRPTSSYIKLMHRYTHSLHWWEHIFVLHNKL